MREKHKAIVQVSAEVLAEALHLPEGATITNAFLDVPERDIIGLVVVHPDLPVSQEGAHFPYVQVVVTKTEETFSSEFIL